MNEELAAGRAKVEKFLHAMQQGGEGGKGGKSGSRHRDIARLEGVSRPTSTSYERLFRLQEQMRGHQKQNANSIMRARPPPMSPLPDAEWDALVARMRKRGFEPPADSSATDGDNATMHVATAAAAAAAAA